MNPLPTKRVPVRRLAAWISSLDEWKTIRISGGLRGAFEKVGDEVPALEFLGAQAATVRVLIPSAPKFDDSESPGCFVNVKPKSGGQTGKGTPNTPGLPGGVPRAPIAPQAAPLSEDAATAREAAHTVAAVEGDAKSTWWHGWAAVLTASTLIAPRVDPVRLADILCDRRRVRFFCDTNALALGIAGWLVHLLPERAEIVTSAIADKEVMNWVDNDKTAHRAATVKSWDTRLRFNLARRLTEAPPDGIVIDRLSPDQNALMLAHGTTRAGMKASDGDLLFVELARPLIREQPRQARVVFLTGDANNARTATSALGPEHILYANVDVERAQASEGRVLGRGFWHPGGPLGTVTQATPGEVLWNLLAAFTYLIVEQSDGVWLIEPAHSVRHGGPSDWANPWVSVTELTPPKPGTSNATPAAASPPGPPAADETPTEPPEGSAPIDLLPVGGPPVGLRSSSSTKAAAAAPNVGPPANDKEPATPVSPSPAAPSEAQIVVPAVAAASVGREVWGPREIWLLPPIERDGPTDTLSSSPRPNASKFVAFLQHLCFHATTRVDASGEVSRETLRVLVGLGAATDDGWPGPRALSFRAAWERNDLDWVHGQLIQAHPGYRRVLQDIQAGRFEELTSRGEQLVPLARRLGQVARFPKPASPPRVGDATLTCQALETALLRWISGKQEGLRVMDACELAANELQVTPFRFERAMMKLWELIRNFPIEARTGGEVEPGASEEVLELHQDGTYALRDVAPGALRFGRSTPILFLVRTR